jgi:energy-coupling factor transporter ATP-binding protein EcfA2
MKEELKSAVSVTNLDYFYPPPRPIHALQDINFEVKRGEFLALIGQNGSGKTTLAKCLSGFIKPQKGQILIDGMDVTHIPAHEQALYVGCVFQNPDHQLFKDTVWEDTAFGLRNIKLEEDIIKKKVDEILSALDLYHFREFHPQRLSIGNRQRLAIACVVVMEPPVIVIDEPTTGQDPQKSREVMGILKDINREKGITVIAITHAMDLVCEYATRAIALCQGEILLDGTVRDVFSQPEVLAKTFVEPPPIVNLCSALGLNSSLPLNISEAKEAITSRLKS